MCFLCVNSTDSHNEPWLVNFLSILHFADEKSEAQWSNLAKFTPLLRSGTGILISSVGPCDPYLEFLDNATLSTVPSLTSMKKRLYRNNVGALAPGTWPLTSCVSLDKAPDFLDLNNFLIRHDCDCKSPLVLAFYESMVELYFLWCMVIKGGYLGSMKRLTDGIWNWV